VLLPCYNAAGTLQQALESLAQQTLTDFELIAVDDGSTDGTFEILQDWASSDERLQLLRQDHMGIVGALNAGLDVCQAEYIARMDADDLSQRERLARQAAFLEQHPETR
jgi:glycosyltransferase involved in cell wall biosynthesis